MCFIDMVPQNILTLDLWECRTWQIPSSRTYIPFVKDALYTFSLSVYQNEVGLQRAGS